MCGTGFTCLADVHLVGVEQAAAVLGISKGAVLVAVHRKRLTSEGKGCDGSHVFSLAALEKYKATRRARRVAQRGPSM